jgi:energy-coupling factor transporter ATP-binding protein EcfA2
MFEAPYRAGTAMPSIAARAIPPETDLLAIVPWQPKSIRDTGLERDVVLALVAKAIHQIGKSHLPVLVGKLRFSLGVLREALDLLVGEQLAEVAWRGETEVDVQYRLTQAGRGYAADCMARCRYIGPAPVTLEAFCTVLARDRVRHAQAGRIGAPELAEALAEDGIDGALREQLGAALHSGRALLLHGPSGSGKSTLARKLGRLLHGVVGVPYAIQIGEHIVQFHDPLVHLAPPPLARQNEDRRAADMRWTICQRPVLQVGAELSRDMLDLRYDVGSGIYHAPPHFQASGGLLVIDDLGRQRIPAAELLNRFLGPLDVGTDVLSFQGGRGERVPFAVSLVFATNLAPQALFDEPSLRRIGYKVHLGALSEANYRALLRRQCRALRVPYEDEGADYLLRHLHATSGRPLLASYPSELLGRLLDFAGFAGRTPRLSAAALEQAWGSMFACSAAPCSNDALTALPHGAALFGER